MANLKPLCSFLLAVFAFSACTNNDPIQARRDLLGPGDYGQIRATRLTPQESDTSLSEVLNTGLSFFLIAGNLTGTRSQFLIRFNGLSGTVKKAELVLPIHLIMGSGMDYTPTVHRVTGEWQEDSVTAAKFNQQFDPAFVGTPRFAALDSLRKNIDKDTLWFELDTLLVQNWIADTTQNLGLLVDVQSPDLLAEYHSRHSLTAVPRLKLVLSQSTGTDTTRFYNASADAFVFTRSVTLPENRLYLGNGERFRTYLAFSPLDSIPADATINRAELQLSVDSTYTLNNEDGFAFITYVVDSIVTQNPLTFELGLPLASGTGLVVASDRTLRLTLTNAVQDWLLRPSANRGLVLQPFGPARDLLRVAFFAERSDPDRAPRLLVDYTIPPK